MSPRPLDPATRTTLIDVAARLLAEGGPGALSTRRLAAEAGTSTMAVYTYFGSMSGLAREIVYDGFARLQQQFDLVSTTADPVADLTLLGRMYRFNAVANRHVYGVMFGGPSLAGFALTEEDRQHGRYTLTRVAECAAQCMAAKRLRQDDPALFANQLWIAMHGIVTLELGGYLTDPYTADRCFEAQLTGLLTGAGDQPERAATSVAGSARRFAALVTAGRDSAAEFRADQPQAT